MGYGAKPCEKAGIVMANERAHQPKACHPINCSVSKRPRMRQGLSYTACRARVTRVSLVHENARPDQIYPAPSGSNAGVVGSEITVTPKTSEHEAVATTPVRSHGTVDLFQSLSCSDPQPSLGSGIQK